MSYKRPEDKEQFINHLRYLLSITDRQRRNRQDWHEMIKLLTEAGHWKRRYRKKDNISIRKFP
jgi:transposase-like protein